MEFFKNFFNKVKKVTFEQVKHGFGLVLLEIQYQSYIRTKIHIKWIIGLSVIEFDITAKNARQTAVSYVTNPPENLDELIKAIYKFKPENFVHHTHIGLPYGAVEAGGPLHKENIEKEIRRAFKRMNIL